MSPGDLLAHISSLGRLCRGEGRTVSGQEDECSRQCLSVELRAGPEEVLILPKQKSLSHMLTRGERSGFSAQPLVRGWLVIFLDSGASAPWQSWPLPPSSMSRCLHVLPHCLLLGQGHPCLHRICGFHGLDGKAAGCPGPVLLTAVRRLPSFSDSFLLKALLLKAAIPRGPGAAPGEVWMGSHHATSHGSYH